jgi:hypothetical protein
MAYEEEDTCQRQAITVCCLFEGGVDGVIACGRLGSKQREAARVLFTGDAQLLPDVNRVGALHHVVVEGKDPWVTHVRVCVDIHVARTRTRAHAHGLRHPTQSLSIPLGRERGSKRGERDRNLASARGVDLQYQ